jgi:MtN3 and saliva related transmembrane protein
MIDFFGSAAALLTAVCWIPQVMRTLRHGKTEHFAWPYLALLSTGVAFWCIYGILRDAPPIYACNGFVLAMVLVVGLVKLRSTLQERSAEEPQFEVTEPEP